MHLIFIPVSYEEDKIISEGSLSPARKSEIPIPSVKLNIRETLGLRKSKSSSIVFLPDFASVCARFVLIKLLPSPDSFRSLPCVSCSVRRFP